MKRIFGQKKPEVKEEEYKGPSLEETSTKMDGQITDIDNKIKKCDEDIKAAMQKMRENPRANAGAKSRAMQAMKRKKMLETQRQQMYGTQFNVEQMQFATENMQTNLEMVNTMKQATAGMKTEMAKVSCSKKHDTIK